MGSQVAAWAITLVLFAALLVGALRTLRRRGVGARMRLVERLDLDARRALFLVEIDGRQLVVGGGEGPVALVTEVATLTEETPLLALDPRRAAS